MTVSNEEPSRPTNGGNAHDRVIMHPTAYGCHFSERDVTRLVKTAFEGFSEVTFSTMRRKPDGETVADRPSLDQVFNIVHENSRSGRAAYLDDLSAEAKLDDGRTVKLAITSERTIVNVDYQKPEDRDWALARAAEVRERLDEFKPHLRSPRAPAKIQAPLGAVLLAVLAALMPFMFASRPAPLGVGLMITAGALCGAVVGISSARYARTVIRLRDRTARTKWLRTPSLAEFALIGVGIAAVVVGVLGIEIAHHDAASQGSTVVTHQQPTVRSTG